MACKSTTTANKIYLKMKKNKKEMGKHWFDQISTWREATVIKMVWYVGMLLIEKVKEPKLNIFLRKV